MPNLFLIASAEDAKLLRKYVHIIGPGLRQATSNVFPDLDGDPKKVTLLILAHQGGDNMPPLLIFGVANWSDEREKLLERWGEDLAIVWRVLIEEGHMSSSFKGKFTPDKVQIWPIMPKGFWSLARPVTQP